jgi:ABC-type sugar transport system permease subunit
VAWRLLFGGRIGFASGGEPLWWEAGFEAWRTLPLATLLLYAALRRGGTALGEAAMLDGAGRARTLRAVYLPLCRPAIATLAAFHCIDYLRAAETPLISVAAAERAIWTLLVLVVATLALRFADRRDPAAGQPG